MSVLKREKTFSLILLGALLLMSLAIIGCGGSEKQDADSQGESSELSGSITIAGSTSVQPFSDVLAEEFMVKYPGTQVNVQGGGSSQGITAVVSGTADIGAVSRELKDEEKAENLKEYNLALDGIAIAVNPANQVSDLTLEQLKNIYLGNITNWSEVGGSDAVITLVNREEGSGTRGAFEELVMGEDAIADYAIVQNSTGAVKTIIETDKNAIGYISLAVADEKVKSLKIEGVEASADNVISGQYKISRPFIYITTEEPTGLVKAYLDFVLSDEGQAIVVEEGAISEILK
ncbi:MAG TPA: phosphate ABC transporter substrate-binding protein [Syntrophomonadaceae bacterium]|nr:phosphate ABC transporter substrate-binding protein [Syntrophomonadaceae bacterium]HPR94103.1 phosphate ABC transporter substrate-binding protein [Syntrophomonadaceae bacterium]